MTPEELAKLTPEQKRTKIAEACGWTEVRLCVCRTRSSGLDPNGSGRGHIPDYLNDLNAMHEAEERLTEEQWKSYCIPLGGRNINWTGAKQMLHATAAQRADAFLLAI